MVGLSHNTAPVEVREKVAVPPEGYPETLVRMSQRDPLRECLVLSTCNRTELYALANFYHDGARSLEDTVRDLGAQQDLSVDEFLYRMGGVDVVRHVFRVASSLDSLIVGEPQILGQVKDAYQSALNQSTAGTVLGRLFRNAIEVGKRVRSETNIGALAISVASVAVDLAGKIFGSMEGRSVLVIGAGDTAQQTLRHLQESGVAHITIANRTLEKAQELARDFGARAVQLDSLREALPQADVIVASATSPEPLVRRADLEAAMKQRKNRSMFMIDIAVPRNVEAAAGEVYNVFLYDIDDLERVVESNRSRRSKEAERAEAIVDEEVERFARWWQGLDSVPTVVQLRSKLESIRGEEETKFLSKLQHLSERDKKLIRQYGNTLVHKILHEPMTQIKRSGEGGAERSAALAASLRYLFKLEDPLATGESPKETMAPAPDRKDEGKPPEAGTGGA
jgi:glutamyl-tRNA reductase